MKRSRWMIALAALALLAAAPPAELQPKLARLSFLLGEWQAEGGGKPGEASGGFTFSASLQGRAIVRTNSAEYPATPARPASRHDDLMVLYAAEGSSDVRADYYDSEGHVIRYMVQPGGENEVTLLSEVSAGAPRFRLSYKLAAGGKLAGRFEVAPPGKPEAFSPYLSWTAIKVVRADPARR